MVSSSMRRLWIVLQRGWVPTLIVVFAVMVAGTVVYGRNMNLLLQRLTAAQMRSERDTDRLHYYDDAIHESLRAATEFGDRGYPGQYRALLTGLTGVLGDIDGLHPLVGTAPVLTIASRAALTDLEAAAVAHLATGQRPAAYALITSARYQELHQRFRADTDRTMSAMNSGIRAKVASTQAQQVFWMRSGAGLGVGFLLIAATLLLLWRRSRRDQLREGIRTAAILDSATVSFAELDEHGRVLTCNRRAQLAMEMSLEQIRGRLLLDIVARPGNPDRERWATLLLAGTGGSETAVTELLTSLPDGRTVLTEVSVWPATVGPGRVNIFARDITDRATLLAQLRDQALTDPLTGLPNRRALTERLDRLAGTDVAAVLLYVDIDEFKVLNDAYGHRVGDLLLQAAADRIGDTVAATVQLTDAEAPASMLCARLGGDEFAVLLIGATAALATTLADDLIAALARPFDLADTAGVSVTVAASLGLARHTTPTKNAPKPAESWQTDSGDQPGPVGAVPAGDLLADADVALYAAKAAGRGRWLAFDHTLRESALQRAVVERELRAGLPRDEVIAHYQPVVRIDDATMVGVEALARWQHPERGLLLPGAFIDVAERTSLIIDLGVAMLARVCAQLADWDRELGSAAPAYVAVNLSARHLGRQHLVTDVAELLAAHGLAAHRLVLEVTEATIIEDTAVANHNLRQLGDLGVRLAVDDFGTGHSSLARLGSLPVHILKIDRSFVQQLGQGGAPLVELTLGLAQALALDVVAEGVETEAQRAHLARLGCANAQGYLYSRPLPPERIADLCRAPAGALSAG